MILGGTPWTDADGVTRLFRCHIVSVGGDLPALQCLGGMMGHNARFPCKFCEIPSVYSGAFHHGYPCLTHPQDSPLPPGHVNSTPDDCVGDSVAF